MSGRVLAAVGAFLGALASAGAVRADAQWSIGVEAGAAAMGDRAHLADGAAFHLGVRGDTLFLRDRDVAVGLGPYAELSTNAFADGLVGAGASLLLPVHPYLPVVVSAGPYARTTGSGHWEPGLSGDLFWGSRSYNYHAAYGLTAGLGLQGFYGLGASKEVILVAAARLDLELVALPFLLLFEAVRHA